MTETSTGRRRVVVDLGRAVEGPAATVVSAAVQLFTAADPVDVVLASAEEPTQEQAQRVQEWCLGAVADPAHLPEIVLVPAAEVGDGAVLVRVAAVDDPANAARAIALLTAVKKLESLVPTTVRLVMIAREISPAIKAYSMAVAPLLSVLSSRTRDRAAWE